ncbi:MAG TPA: hypothetical protein DEQ20_01185, partial [Desulfobulbaceae bacterium]|nr:hypothetical protein [Desulfobulbaceae bacterium]
MQTVTEATLPPLGITMGCPVGIGPEIILRFLAQVATKTAMWPVVIGDAGVLRRCAKALNIQVRVVDWQPGAPVQPQALNVCSLSDLGDELIWGKPTIETGRAMGSYIEEGVRLVRQAQLAGLVTCPISKAALTAGGYRFPGHTEMLAELCQAKDFAMMMAGSRLKITLVSIHQALAEVPAAITQKAVLRMIAITGRALQDDFGLPHPRLAVAGLNPHAGEGGMFGDEELRVIAPAVVAARLAGWQVEGPFPPDTVFNKAVAGQFDAVVSMYHDQGLIPFKLLHFSDGVNVTLGLPIVRTSVDHGTAYDIAGLGLADPTSLAAAVSLAEVIVANRRNIKLSCTGSNGMERKGWLIAFEGIDGTGKTTQIAMLAAVLCKRGLSVVATKEPTDGQYGLKIRELYKNRKSVTPEEELALFLDDRREHVVRVIAPALACGQVVLTDRYYYSTAAYQGAAGHDPQKIITANELFAPVPDMVIILEAPVSLGVHRVQRIRGEVLNDFEQEETLVRVA